MTDSDIAQKATHILSLGNYSRFSLAKRIGISKEKLDRIAQEHDIKNYPAPMSASQSATYGRSLGDKWGGKFKLRGSPNFG